MQKILNREFITQSYDYSLPKELIAKYPSNPKDSAKLLVYDRKNDKITHTIFRDIINFIPKDTTLILNNTKVIKARIFGVKESGGKIELLLNRPLENNKFNAFIRGKVKVGTILTFENLSAKVIELIEDGSRVVKFFREIRDNKELNFIELNKILNKIGHIPLPPYIDRDDDKNDESLYQPIFAKNFGAVAAPTASLHFTDELFKKIEEKFDTKYITLHVGAGTFKPVDVQEIIKHQMHSEVFEILKDTKEVIESKKNILAVGTTVTRTIEFFAREKILSGECNLFLHPNNTPIRVNHLLTNFHLPKSTLIMLVASFVGLDKTLRLYEEAIKRKYRFYSYGDAMLII